MPSVPASQARAQFTQMVIDTFTDRLPPTSFLRSFFPTDQSFTRYLSIEVEREFELIAVDVQRGSEGNLNTWSKSTEKVFDPPYYKEKFNLTDIDLYDRLFGSMSIDDGVYTQLVQTVVKRLIGMRNKIERAYEKQCAQVLETGIVTLISDANIDFKRKAASLVDKGSGNYWATSTISPYDDLENGCNFLRQVGKAGGATYNAIMGAGAYRDFLNNAIVKERNNLKQWSLDNIIPTQRNALGASLHGQVDAGSYRVNIWTYPQSYDVSGTPTAYVNDTKVILLPEVPHFKLGFAAVPQLLKAGTGTVEDDELNPPIAAPYVVGDYIDQAKDAHVMDIKSAGIAIPTAVDQIYTVKVKA